MRRGLLVFGNVMVILALLVVVVGCAGETASPPAATAAPGATAAPAASQNKEPIKIGLIGNLSNPVGKSNNAALEISIGELNKAGGILGRPVQLLVEDSKWQVPLAVAAYRKLVTTEGCLVVVTEGVDGGLAMQEAGSSLYPEYPHMQFGIWCASDELTDRVRDQYDKYKHFFMFHMKPSSIYDERINFWSLFTDTLQTKKLAFMCEDMTWTQPFSEGIPGKFPPMRQGFEARGIEVVYEARNAANEKMFLPILEQIAASGADTIFWWTAVTDTATLAKQWADSAAKDINLASGSGSCSYASFWDMTGGAALGYLPQYPEIDTPYTNKTIPFVQALKANGAGLVASTYAACDIPWFLKAAVEEAGDSNDVEALIKAMETVEVQYAFWKWKFDKAHYPFMGDPYFPTIHGQFQEDGKFVVVHSEHLRKLTNPDDKFIPVKELRAKAAQ